MRYNSEEIIMQIVCGPAYDSMLNRIKRVLKLLVKN